MNQTTKPNGRETRLPTPPAPDKAFAQSRWIKGRYHLKEVAGSGGMARVWRGIQHGSSGFERQVAIKEMHEHLCESKQYVEMFAEEARIGSILCSPNNAHIYDFIEEHRRYYLVMEWIDGVDVGSYVNAYLENNKTTPWSYVAGIAIGVLRALANAHERTDALGKWSPIVHRDISPHNVLIKQTGTIKVIDWGLSLAPDRRNQHTEPGVVKGKMSYLAPEVVCGDRPTPLSDQFAVGCLLWEALAGQRLFHGVSDLDVYRKVKACDVPRLRSIRKDIPKALNSTIERALEKDPSKRFPSTREFGKAIAKILKSNAAPKDLHALLGQSVSKLKEAEAQSNSSAVQPHSRKLIFDNTPTLPWQIPEADKKAITEPKKKGLLHKLPFWGSKRI